MNVLGALVALVLLTVTPATFAESNWSQADTDSFVQGCVLGILKPAEREYYAKAEKVGNKNPKPFPEQEVKASIEPMCTCVANKLKAEGISILETTTKSSKVEFIVKAAILNGECKLGGMLGQELEKQKGQK